MSENCKKNYKKIPYLNKKTIMLDKEAEEPRRQATKKAKNIHPGVGASAKQSVKNKINQRPLWDPAVAR